MNDRTDPGETATDEPALTQQNSETIRGETTLADGGTAESNVDESSTRTRSGAIPSSYGAAGGTTDATEEGGDGTGI
ncbi:MAG TPA: hypothetical protein VFF00_08190 [Candidatus Elarobacter sp.]|nr:hypothetical protein [Dongiaceae bacterium]HZW54000.1 hypothetical protein [Candidatus Elarobacter sp.]